MRPGTENRAYFEHYRSDDSKELERWYACPCCGYPTKEGPADFEICILCSWMDDGDPWNYGGLSLEEARSNFSRYRTKYPPGSAGFENEAPWEREHKEKMIAAYDRYMEAKDLRLKTELWKECRRLSDSF